MAVGLDQPVRARPYGWARCFWAYLRWNLWSLRLFLPVLALVQLLMGVGFAIAIGFFFGRVPPPAALYFATGLPVINLLTLGFLSGPQNIAGQKVSGSYEFMRTLPVSTSVECASWAVVSLVGGAPAMLATLAVAGVRYHVHYVISPAVVPAVLLVTGTGAMLGLALGHAVRRPNITEFVSQFAFFAVFGFCPIALPARQLPGWLQALNLGLPFEHMANVVRAGLTSGVVSGTTRSYLVLAAWALGSYVLVRQALARRG